MSSPHMPHDNSSTGATNAQKSTHVPKSIWASSFVSLALASLIVLETIGISTYAYYRVQRATDPEVLGDRVVDAIAENYPEFRQDLVMQVKEQAPRIAEQVSQQVVQSVPDAREQLEELTARQLAFGLDKATSLSADQFREILQQNRQQLVQAFETVEQAPEEARQLVLETEASIEQQLGIKLQNQAKYALQAHHDLNEKLALLTSPPENLDAQAQLERRIVRILRGIQVHQADEWQIAGR